MRENAIIITECEYCIYDMREPFGMQINGIRVNYSIMIMHTIQ